jgi:hypothetical protein
MEVSSEELGGDLGAHKRMEVVGMKEQMASVQMHCALPALCLCQTKQTRFVRHVPGVNISESPRVHQLGL